LGLFCRAGRRQWPGLCLGSSEVREHRALARPPAPARETAHGLIPGYQDSSASASEVKDSMLSSEAGQCTVYKKPPRRLMEDSIGYSDSAKNCVDGQRVRSQLTCRHLGSKSHILTETLGSIGHHRGNRATGVFGCQNGKSRQFKARMKCLSTGKPFRRQDSHAVGSADERSSGRHEIAIRQNLPVWWGGGLGNSKEHPCPRLQLSCAGRCL